MHIYSSVVIRVSGYRPNSHYNITKLYFNKLHIMDIKCSARFQCKIKSPNDGNLNWQ